MHPYTALTAVTLLSSASAFPTIPGLLTSRQTGEANSGFFPNTGFNAADQYVNVGPGSGHEWQAPGPTDVRGPCPGLVGIDPSRRRKRFHR